MTTARRIAALEATLGPTERIVAWLVEAHAFDTFDGYFRASIAEGIGGLPLDRLIRETRAGAEEAHRSLPSDQRDQQVRAELRQMLFRFHLVMRTIVVVGETLEHEGLVQGFLS
jgi:hypothetical protein